ncbi:MAG: radical SAM protein, partial [Candidatus Aminicenantes bacterium]|nr:radical SAM protein [Candidatus Aminicenantes bacterium]
EAIKGIIDVFTGASYTDYNEMKTILREKKIPNLAFKVYDKMIATQRRLTNLNKAYRPYRYFLDAVIKSKGIVRIEGSRGCPWGRCSFCAITAKYGQATWRPYPVDYIINELVDISAADGLNPYFTDENFIGVQPKRLVEFAERLQEAKNEGTINPDLQYYVNMTVNDVIKNKELLITLKETGLREVFLGLESGADDQLKRYSKMANIDLNMKALSTLKELNLVLDAGFIMFDPEMTLQDLIDNMKFIEECGLIDHDARDIKRVRIEPSTDLAQQLIEKDYVYDLDVDSLTYNYDFKDPLIQRIWDVYKDWESKSLDVVYKFQGYTRGEIESEKKRLDMKSILGKFRENDYNMLHSLIKLGIENSDLLNDNKYVEKYIRKYEDARNRLLSYIKGKWDIW